MRTTPWILAKDDATKPRLETVLYNLVEGITMGATPLKELYAGYSGKDLRTVKYQGDSV